MKSARATKMKRSLPLMALTLLGLSAAAGCDTYHYYDIDVSFGTVTEEEASKLQLCTLVVSGADSHEASFPDGSGQGGKTVCPIGNNWPDMGTFEFASFADSGKITLTVNGYKTSPPTTANLCTSGSISFSAGAEITQPGTITMGTFDDANCPSSITTGTTN